MHTTNTKLTTPAGTLKRALLLAPLVAAGALALPAAGAHGHAGAASRPSAARTAALPHITITAKDWSMAGPARVPAGYVRFTIVAPPGPPSQAFVALLKPGMSRAQAAAVLKKADFGAITTLMTAMGGPASLGGAADDILDLQAGDGDYAIFTITQDAKGVSHARYTFISVAPAAKPATEPASTVTVHEMDMKFKLPRTLPSGDVTLKIVNMGPSIHETVLARLHQGKTVKQLASYLSQQNPSGPPPADFIGGAAAMASGHTQWATERLTPGAYVAVCFMPDKQGKPHIADGMITPFAVR